MIDKSWFPKFFAAHRRACLALGLTTAVDQDAYYRKVVSEVASVFSVKAIETPEDFTRCIERFDTDAGAVRQPADSSLEKQKRMAYVVKVFALQIIQLEGFSARNSRAYIEGILIQSKLGAGYRAAGPSYWMDLPPVKLWKCLQILDTHLRRIKDRLGFPPPHKFNDREAYRWNDGKLAVEAVEKYHYANAPE